MQLVLVFVSAVSALVHDHAHELMAATQLRSSEKWRSDCGKKVDQKYSMAQNPGAGMGPDSIEPFEKVYKDGYMLTACVKDAMYEAGDKFGKNKQKYKMGPVSNSSIVHYDAHVAKEDREEMTHDVCFEFCRGVPDMGYFGITNGRDCYCTPYFQEMASDDSGCDAVCPGDKALMCGGSTKTSIFSMHLCADTKADLATAEQGASEARNSLRALARRMKRTANAGEGDANTWQEALGAVGDATAAGLMQRAQAFSGKVIKTADDSLDLAVAVKRKINRVRSVRRKDFTEYDNAKQAEKLVEALNSGVEQVSKIEKELDELDEDLEPALDDAEGAAKQYYPLMYFVDKNFEDVPSTCGGETLGEAKMGQSMDECAASCNALPGKCVGFSFFEKDSSLCFLFSKFESVQYYTGCEEGQKNAPPKFLQTQKSSGTATCQGKLQSFQGLNLTPQGDGKCDSCLKEATKADRCW